MATNAAYRPGSHAAPIARGEIDARAQGSLGKVRWYRPTIRVVALPDGSRAVVKDFRSCPWFWRATYGRWLTRRETRAYERIAEIPGIPRFLGRIDRYAVMIEWAPGTCIGKCAYGSIGVETFERLSRTVEALHERGVVHMDLRQKQNVIVDPAGVPRIIDFSSAFVFDPTTRLGRRLIALFRGVDLTGVLKNKRRFVPDAITPEEAARLAQFARRRRFWPF